MRRRKSAGPGFGPAAEERGNPPLSTRNVRRAPDPSRPSLAPIAVDEDSAPRRRWLSERVAQVTRVALGTGLALGIAFGVAWGARTYIHASPRFAVSDIVVSGAKHRTADEISVIAGIEKGQNVFSVDLAGASARLLADPWIGEAHVSRQLPGAVVVRVVEREAAALLGTSDGTYLVTREGAIIKRVEEGDPTDFHVVTGVDAGALVADREGTTRIVRRALDLASDYDHSPLARRSALEEVHVEPNGEMTLVVGKSGVALRLGAGPYRRKIEQAVRVVAELDRRGARPDTIMLDNESRPERVVVRVR